MLDETQPKLIDLLSKISTEKDLRSIIPPTVKEKLGGGEVGTQRVIDIIVYLQPFYPDVFDREDWDFTVGLDENSEPLPQEINDLMFEFAMEAGFIMTVEERTGWYEVDERVSTLADKISQ